MANHFSADQWRNWFLEFEQSELTVVRFCDSIGVSVQSFYKWRKRLRQLGLYDQPNRDRESVAEYVSVLLPGSMISIELPGGAIARVPNDAESLRPILSVLLNRESAQ